MSIFDGLTFNFDNFADMPRCYGEFSDNTRQNKGCTLTALWHGLGFKSKSWMSIVGTEGDSRPNNIYTHPLTGEVYDLKQMIEATDAWALALISEANFCKQVMRRHDGGTERTAMALTFKLLRAAKLYPLQPQGVVEDAAPQPVPSGLVKA